MPPRVYEFKTRSVPDVGDQGREDIWGSRLWRFLRATKTTEITSGGLLHSQGYHTHTRIRRSVVWTRLKMQETTRGHNPAPATGSATSSTPPQSARRHMRATFVGGAQAAAPELVQWIGRPLHCPLALPHLHAQGSCAGRERGKFNPRSRYTEPDLRVMEASRGFAEAGALSPEQAARYLRYIWVAGRV